MAFDDIEEHLWNLEDHLLKALLHSYTSRKTVYKQTDITMKDGKEWSIVFQLIEPEKEGDSHSGP